MTVSNEDARTERFAEARAAQRRLAGVLGTVAAFAFVGLVALPAMEPPPASQLEAVRLVSREGALGEHVGAVVEVRGPGVLKRLFSPNSERTVGGIRIADYDLDVTGADARGVAEVEMILAEEGWRLSQLVMRNERGKRYALMPAVER